MQYLDSMSSKLRVLYIVLLIFTGCLVLQAQETNALTDSLPLSDSTLVVPADSIAPADSLPPHKNALEAPVTYTAKDSIVMTRGNWAYLFGESNVKYQQIELQSENIEMNMDSSLVFAKFGVDSIGEEFGHPIFIDGGQQYESREMRYNFKTRKGFITDVITQQGEGYVTAGRTKKMEDDIMNMVGGRYTTCDEHDHPHFYIQMTKAKVRPKKNIVTGPVYLVIEDVPLYPLGLPFAFFPFSETYSSGILFPSFRDESVRGFGLENGGYYFAINDYVDLALTGQFYSKGSWGLEARSAYRKRYKFSGNFNANYLVSKTGDRIMYDGRNIGDQSVSKDFKVNWTHSQDAKANPYLTFSASVNFSTSSFERNNLQSLMGATSVQNTKGSSVNMTKRFPNSPFSLSGTMNINQVARDTTLSMTFPDLTLTMSRIFPFKRKMAIGSERWYEKISMSYTGYLRNSITAKEYEFFNKSLVRDWNNSMRHQIPVSATFNMLNYINITPSFNYTENWYTHKIEREYDVNTDRLVPSDTIYGFNRVYNYNASVSASTTMYGMFTPMFNLFGIEKIRHKMDPSVSVGFAPDFANRKYGFYREYEYFDANGINRSGRYSLYETSAPSGKQGNVTFSLDNNIEAKVKSNSDSTGVRKISLVDKLGFSMAHNMVADSFKWSDLTVSLRLKLTKSYSINMTGIFDTYMYTYDTSPSGVRTPRRINKLRIQGGQGLGRLRSTGTSFSYTFNNDTFKKLFAGRDDTTGDTGDTSDPDAMSEDGSLDMFDQYGNNQSLVPEDKTPGGRLRGKKRDASGEYDADGYWRNGVPWSLSFNYNVNMGYGEFNFDKKEYKYKLTHALSFSGNIQPTKNWRVNFNATYDFEVNKLSYLTCNLSRNLHCFNMSASLSPVGNYKFYTFSVAVSSSLLKDMKYDRRSNYREGQSWY